MTLHRIVEADYPLEIGALVVILPAQSILGLGLAVIGVDQRRATIAAEQVGMASFSSVWLKI